VIHIPTAQTQRVHHLSDTLPAIKMQCYTDNVFLRFRFWPTRSKLCPIR